MFSGVSGTQRSFQQLGGKNTHKKQTRNMTLKNQVNGNTLFYGVHDTV